MISYADALRLIESEVWAMQAETVPVSKAIGRALAQEVTAPFDLPMFDNSAVDGYGVRIGDLEAASNDRPVELTVAGTSQAGGPLSVTAAPGTAVQIFTGAPTPEGVEAVVMQEDVVREDGVARFSGPAHQGAHIRRRGEELRSGEKLYKPGTLVTPPLLASLAGLGLSEVEVYGLPKVGVITTGNELVSPGESLKPGQIYESNSFGLQAALAAAGVLRVETWRVRDEPETTEAALGELLAVCNLVISTGGVSVGEFDEIKPALKAVGAREVFWKCAVKPGKPIWFGAWESAGHKALVFGLPGNPVSALVTYAMFVVPALKAMAGLRFESPPTVPAVLAEGLEKSGDRLEFVRCTLEHDDSRLVAGPQHKRGSHMLGSMGAAEGLIHFPLESHGLQAGQIVDVTPLRWGWV